MPPPTTNHGSGKSGDGDGAVMPLLMEEGGAGGAREGGAAAAEDDHGPLLAAAAGAASASGAAAGGPSSSSSSSGGGGSNMAPMWSCVAVLANNMMGAGAYIIVAAIVIPHSDPLFSNDQSNHTHITLRPQTTLSHPPTHTYRHARPSLRHRTDGLARGRPPPLRLLRAQVRPFAPPGLPLNILLSPFF